MQQVGIQESMPALIFHFCLACSYSVKSRALLAGGAGRPHSSQCLPEELIVDQVNGLPKRAYLKSTEDVVHLGPS